MIRLLGRHEVRYVLIGGLAAITHGAPLVTQDVDVCHARDPANLDRLADALREVRAELRGAEPGFRSALTPRRSPRGDAFTFTTAIGWLDIMATPAASPDTTSSRALPTPFTLFGHEVQVASVDDLIRMKRAAGRRKDLLALEELGALRDEMDSRPR